MDPQHESEQLVIAQQVVRSLSMAHTEPGHMCVTCMRTLACRLHCMSMPEWV